MDNRSLRDIAAAIEYTDLRKEITYRDVEAMCAEALFYGFHTVVIPSNLVPLASRVFEAAVARTVPLIATVISYPFGTQAIDVKTQEASAAAESGARELDVVPHFGAILSGEWRSVRKEMAAIRHAAGDTTLKLVLEAGRLQPNQIREVCCIAADEGFRFVSNTLGFRVVSTDPTAEGSATPETIRSLRSLAVDTLGIKASGAAATIRSVFDLLDAGADRVTIPARYGLLRALQQRNQ